MRDADSSHGDLMRGNEMSEGGKERERTGRRGENRGKSWDRGGEWKEREREDRIE